jgi:hypothetical protein
MQYSVARNRETELPSNCPLAIRIICCIGPPLLRMSHSARSPSLRRKLKRRSVVTGIQTDVAALRTENNPQRHPRLIHTLPYHDTNISSNAPCQTIKFAPFTSRWRAHPWTKVFHHPTRQLQQALFPFQCNSCGKMWQMVILFQECRACWLMLRHSNWWYENCQALTLAL